MNENDEKEIVVSDPVPTRRIHPAAFVVAGVAALGLLLLVGWYFLGNRGEAGKPVPAPRTSMDQPPADTTTNPTLILSPEQIKNAGITIETVGEQLATDATETSATG